MTVRGVEQGAVGGPRRAAAIMCTQSGQGQRQQLQLKAGSVATQGAGTHHHLVQLLGGQGGQRPLQLLALLHRPAVAQRQLAQGGPVLEQQALELADLQARARPAESCTELSCRRGAVRQDACAARQNARAAVNDGPTFS